MSAYIVDKPHITYLLAAAMSPAINRYGNFRWYFGESRELPAGDYDRAAQVGNMLWQENVRSVAHRYPDGNLPGPIGEIFVITPAEIPGCVHIDPLQVLKACDCLEYQSCEHPEWRESEAKTFLDTLRKRAYQSIPGYEAAAWGGPRTPARSIARPNFSHN